MLTPLNLEDGSILVIRARLDEPPPLTELGLVVSADEHARAALYIHDADRHRHIIGRGILRHAVAAITHTVPGDVRFSTSELGKLSLPDGPSFNISHSGNFILVAVALEGRLGVDVEAVRPLRDLLGLARTSFAYDELCTVATLPEEQRLRPFFRTWARKEAVLKALGLGLTALDAISVSAAEGFHDALVRLDLPGESVDRWTVRSIACHPQVEAAVAWDRPVRSILLRDV